MPISIPELLRKIKRRIKKDVPSVGRIKLGSFNRTTPFSRRFGYDRGGPLDRYYIENFLKKNASVIRGRVLEIGDNEYTLEYGGTKVSQSDILHIDSSNPKATFVGDLSEAPHLPSNSFDCIILTQTMQLIYDCRKAIETCYRILRPGGTILITVPGIGHISNDDWAKNWFWAFTNMSVKKMILEFFPPQNISVETFGNVLVASAYLFGMGLPELKKEQMDSTDVQYQVIITALATKPV